MLWAVCHSSSCSSALPPCPTDLLLCVLCCSHAFTLVRASTDVFSFVLCCCPLIQCYVTVEGENSSQSVMTNAFYFS